MINGGSSYGMLPVGLWFYLANCNCLCSCVPEVFDLLLV